MQKTQRSISQQQFYHLCETLKKHREDFAKSTKSLTELARVASTLTDCTISEHSLKRACEVLDLPLHASKQRSPLMIVNQKINRLTQLTEYLYRQLGLEQPAETNSHLSQGA